MKRFFLLLFACGTNEMAAGDAANDTAIDATTDAKSDAGISDGSNDADANANADVCAPLAIADDGGIACGTTTCTAGLEACCNFKDCVSASACGNTTAVQCKTPAQCAKVDAGFCVYNLINAYFDASTCPVTIMGTGMSYGGDFRCRNSAGIYTLCTTSADCTGHCSATNLGFNVCVP